jgi:phage FluMu protein Com
MSITCPRCHQDHKRSEDVVGQIVRAGLYSYIDALCPWCRFVYDLGRTLNSPLGAILCGVAIGAVAIRIKETLS